MSIKLIRAKRERVTGEDYWRYECRKARKEREFYKCWSAVYLHLLGFLTMVIMYLVMYGGKKETWQESLESANTARGIWTHLKSVIVER